MPFALEISEFFLNARCIFRLFCDRIFLRKTSLFTGGVVMGKQLLVSISRTYGSGGHEIGRRLAERLGIGFVDRELLDHIAAEKGVDVKNLERYDERLKLPFLSRTVRGHSNAPEEALAEMQFDYILKKAAAGESFVVIGRCVNQVLKDYECLSTIFISGDMESRIDRITEIRGMDRAKARVAIRRHDRARRAYHNHYSSRKWNDLAAYDLVLNSSKLGIENSIDAILHYLKLRNMLPEGALDF